MKLFQKAWRLYYWRQSFPREQKLFWVPLILLPGTILLGAAAYFHWKLPKNQKTLVKVSFWRGESHVYLTFFAALLMNVIAFWGELQGWNGVADAISTVIAILFAFAIIGARFYGRLLDGPGQKAETKGIPPQAAW